MDEKNNDLEKSNERTNTNVAYSVPEDPKNSNMIPDAPKDSENVLTRPKLNSFFRRKKLFSLSVLINKLRTLNVKKLQDKKTLLLLLVILFIGGIVIFSRLQMKSGIQREQPIMSKDDGFTKLVIPEREQPFFRLETKKVRKFGILPTEEFVLRTIRPVSIEYISSVLEDSQNFNIQQTGDKEFIIKNRDILDVDEPISINLNTKDQEVGGHVFDRNYNWAFQSQGKFRVVSTIPGNEKTKVPVNTGIEIVFSQDDFKNPINLVEIEPKVEFTSKIVDETFVIIPKQPLQYETVYTVKLRKGLKLNSRNDQINEDFEFSFQTQEEKKPEKPKPWISINDNFVQTSPTEPFITKVSTANWNNDIKVDVRVFKFRNSSDFVSTREEYDEAVRDWREYYPKRHTFSEDLVEVLREEVNVQEQDRIKYLQLSKNLDPGYYLVEFRVEGKLASNQVWYQSSEISGYISLGRKDIIVWVNDLASKTPAVNALVRSISTGGTWAVDSNGIAKFPSALEYFDDDDDYFEISEGSGRSVILPVRSQKGNAGPGEISEDDYWSYLYTEKIYYLSNDTVNIWGVIKDRDTGGIPQAKLSLVRNDEEVYSETLNPLTDGSFITKIPLLEAPEGWYQLQLKVGNTVLDKVSFTVRQYVKPDMKIEISATKKAIFTDEEVNFDVKTTFFDETPGSNIDLNIHENQSGKKTTSKTNDNGNIKYTYKPSYREGNYYPRYEGISAIPGITQESIVEGNGSVRVFGPKITMSTERNQSTNKASFTATINKIDLTTINNGTSNSPKGDVVPGKEVNINIEESWTERVETGTSYNFIEKITYKTYRYDRKSETIKNTSFTTNDSGQISHLFEMTEGRSYTVTLSANDNDGKKVTRKLYFYASKWSSSSGYYGKNEDTNIYLDLAFGRDINTYSVGEEVYVKLTQQGDDYKKLEDDSFLFTKSQRGRQDVFVEEIPQFSFQFLQENVPNIFVSAVVFNGRFYKRANGVCRRDWVCSGLGYRYHYYYDYYGLNQFKGIQISHNIEDSKLDIEIITSKPKYEPGERVNLQAVVTKNGTPVTDVSVNLVMVDAALSAIGGVRTPSALTSVHEAISHQVYYVYTSHEPIVPDTPAAEMGGGGGDRDLFKDTAAFYQSQTNSSGVAEFNFNLPDNITTWLVYTQAISTNLDAGQADSSLIATKDFFVISKFPNNILVDDSSHISVNSFGVVLDEDSSISYNVLFNENGREIEKQEGKERAFVEKDFKIPELSEGIYDVVVRGEYSDKQDGISLPLEVLRSRIKQEYSIKHNVSEGEKITNLITDDYLEKEPVILIISDRGKGKFFYTLTNYCYRSRSNRLERKMVSKRSDILLRDKFDYKDCHFNEPQFSEFQGADGGLSQVIWGGSHLDTSLWSVIVAPDEFDREKLIEYFSDKYLNNQGGSLQKIQAGWALSLLGESKLRELKGLVMTVTSFDEKVNLGLALAQLGDKEVARELYFDILADYAYELNPYIRIDSKQNRGAEYEDFVVETSKVLLLGEFVDSNYNDGMYEYIDDYRGSLENYLIDLSEIEYVKTAITNLPDSNTVYTMTTSRGTESETLNRGNSKWYELNAEDVENYNFTLGAGKANLLTKYLIGVDTLRAKQEDSRLSINRTITKAKPDGNSVKPGDIVKITLELTLDLDNAPKGSYQVKDSIPSGLTYLSNPGGFGLTRSSYPRKVIGNTITFNTYNSEHIFKGNKYSIIYYAKASAVGTFKAEPAVFQSLNELTVFSMTDDGTVVIE